MKHIFKGFFAVILVLALSLGTVPVFAGEGGQIIVLFTNDVHCAIDG